MVAADQEEIDLLAVIANLWVYRWSIIATAAFFVGVAIVVAWFTTPVYRATVVLVPASNDKSGLGASLSSALGQIGGLASLAGISTGSSSTETEEALAVLRSRQLTEAFVTDLKLVPLFFQGEWDRASGRWKNENDPPTPARAFKYFDSKVRFITQDRKTGLVTLRIEWTDREQAATWANELVRRINEEMRARAIANVDASVGFLEKELSTTSVLATRDAIGRLIESQIRQRMLANVSHEYSFRVVDSAMVPDIQDRIRPQRALIVAIGLLLGVVIGIVLAFCRHYFASSGSVS